MCWLRYELYTRLPEEFCVVKDADGNEYPVELGKFRDHPAHVGHHIVPRADELSDFGYGMLLNDGVPVGGLVQREHSKALSVKDGSTARWVPYIASENLNEVVVRAIAAGGESIRPVTPMADRGELALLQDSQGAYFGGARPALGSKPDKLAAPGDWIHKRLFTKDTAAAAEFYSKTFGYEAVLDTSTLIEEDYALISEGYNRAAILPLPAALVIRITTIMMIFISITVRVGLIVPVIRLLARCHRSPAVVWE